MRDVDLVQAYDRVLEQQILGRGSCRAVQDEALRSEVEGLLATSDPRELHGLGLEPLRLMEEVLEARPGSGLRGLARAFEVLEQAALNLYLGPWREEYRVIKMYSGTFTHCVAPVLSAPQTEELFGLLGYRPGPARTRLLRLQAGGGPVAPRELLRLACGFFLARCECRLLLAALGKRGGARWELGVVRERRGGQRLQVAVDNAERLLSVPEDAEGELDLYREDGAAPGRRRGAGPVAAPRSRRSGPADRGRPRDPCGCLGASPLGPQRCLDCGVLHDGACVRLSHCRQRRHQVEPASVVPETGEERDRDAVPEDAAAVRPIGYHCEAAGADPHLLCLTCRAVHGAACEDGGRCRSAHRTRRLGTCSCGKSCCGTPRVLCLYCGDEFCRDCWYKNPLSCVCGHSFHLSSDPSSSA